jgi:hypothetical protein
MERAPCWLIKLNVTETPADTFQELSEEIQKHLINLIELQGLFDETNGHIFIGEINNN